MLHIAVIVGKAVILALKLAGKTGSALPGLVVEKLYPAFLNRTLGNLPHGVVVISGTNGKTTTTKVTSQLLEAQGLRVLTNSTGSNFVRGIISTTLRAISISGKLPYDVAVLELDEAHAVQLTRFVSPRGLVALNVMRDQMDRFGEIDTTAKLLESVANQTSDWLVLNSNDPRIARITQPDKRVVWFGHASALASMFAPDDQKYASKTEHFEAHPPEVNLRSYNKNVITLDVGDTKIKETVLLDGSHNAINIAAAVACVRALLPDIDLALIANELPNLQPAFGRGEHVRLDSGQTLRLQLVKNPGGFTHSLRITEEQSFGAVGIIINDDYADGRDVSWLWDVEFQGLADYAPIVCGGSRAYDMNLRLKYDGVNTDHTLIDLESMLRQLMAVSRSDDIVIFCTYTAMIKLRRILKDYSSTLQEVGV